MSKSTRRSIGANSRGMIEPLEGRTLMSVSADAMTELLPLAEAETIMTAEQGEGPTTQPVTQVLKTRHDTAKNAISHMK